MARLTIDNAAKLNSLNRELMVEIVEAVKALETDPELRLVIVTGAGDRAFVGGADINEL
ncbi:MAG: enoyl-CoA hydratase/isomerase family protein, partial [Alphaproteobacteria bacterium]|nr:enoyl-CoA hydratase/isomerase family protein [Alphaproteobacteria bacterium]